ncbi:phosphatidate cytidylyltransferase [Coralliovum pocilloporae]|uniref:phosphatidate cytidylyltransferase n=1 Tax=Coralliovum pocilloporae TaxID=3066369 RepID=UPI0033072681
MVARTVSALFLGVLVIGATVYGGWVFALLIGFGALIIHSEIVTITGNRLLDPLSILVALGLAAAVVCTRIASVSDLAMWIALAAPVLAIGVRCVQKNAGWMVFSGLYGAAFALPLIWLRMDLGGDAPDLGLAALAFLFAVVWGTDVCAYFAGRLIGGPKLCPPISPGKTWSGAVGGTVGGVLLGVLLMQAMIETSVTQLLFIAVGLSVVSQIGDLGESWFKRSFNVKDSGRILPGHGGLMDRVDGLVTAGVLACVIGWLRMPENPAQGLLVW